MRQFARAMEECAAELKRMPDWAFASDNAGGAHPKVLQAMQMANDLPATAPYGECVVTHKAAATVRSALGLRNDDWVRFVVNGTGGNLLSLVMGAHRPYYSVVGTKSAHMATNTAGGVEHVVGVKMHLLDEDKVSVGKLVPYLEHCRAAPEFYTIPKVLTLTQSNEWGSVYSLSELQALRKVADDFGLFIHIDGARISNAIAALADGGDAHAIAQQMVGLADLVTFGAAKNGAATSEAVIIKRHVCPNEAEIKAASKQSNLVVSKARFVSSQMLAYFTDDLWLANAQHANAMCRYLHGLLAALPQVTLEPPVTNMLYVTLRKSVWAAAKAQYTIYEYGETDATVTLRLVTAWDTTPEACEKLRDAFRM
eukprot:TRINITY_DN12873_c0_g1_i1.p2 TRINITY_DN12873_c0_g1~~TRINITY_DN12873_c0_g1_i1.p2  ORF type:complete len:368 (+),score=118.02 TRINITY_DN12873_c0_g1_i1:160-1263(+)